MYKTLPKNVISFFPHFPHFEIFAQIQKQRSDGKYLFSTAGALVVVTV